MSINLRNPFLEMGEQKIASVKQKTTIVDLFDSNEWENFNWKGNH